MGTRSLASGGNIAGPKCIDNCLILGRRVGGHWAKVKRQSPGPVRLTGHCRDHALDAAVAAAGDKRIIEALFRHRSAEGLQRFTSVFSAVRNLFVPSHSRRSALASHLRRLQAMAAWKVAAGVIA